MDFSRELVTQLDGLTKALDGSGDDLHAILSVLVDDLRTGISSFVGLSITVSAGWEPVTVTTMSVHTAVTSMLLPLGAAHAGGGDIVLYAETPGAFTDLAADARIALGRDDEIVVDGHLPPPTAFAAQASVDTLVDRSTIDQAVGYLIEQGYPPARAKTELSRRAAATGISLAQIAAQVRTTERRPDPEDQDEDPDERSA
ncbi:MAG: ANTAR domain-containing protein [Nakamurella sp.]